MRQLPNEYCEEWNRKEHWIPPSANIIAYCKEFINGDYNKNNKSAVLQNLNDLISLSREVVIIVNYQLFHFKQFCNQDSWHFLFLSIDCEILLRKIFSEI